MVDEVVDTTPALALKLHTRRLGRVIARFPTSSEEAPICSHSFKVKAPWGNILTLRIVPLGVQL